LLQVSEEGLGREQPGARRRELDREGQAVELDANRRDRWRVRRGERERGVGGLRPRREERNCWVLGELRRRRSQLR
jgi:hypothetical protein